MENKKIKNATPAMFNGVRYRSKFEVRVAECLTNSGLLYEYEPFRIELLPNISYDGHKYRSVHYTPDFVVRNHIIEVKGFPNDAWPIKEKLLVMVLSRMSTEGNTYHYHKVKTLKDLQEVIEILKHEDFC